jgi:hypothetical protein
MAHRRDWLALSRDIVNTVVKLYGKVAKKVGR